MRAIHIILIFLCSDFVYSAENNCINDEIKSFKVESIEINSNPIFSEDESNSWFYNMGNKIHINTNEDVIKKTLPFQINDVISIDLLVETERILRTKKYLRDAEISYSVVCGETNEIKITINTWDNWSLKPTADFGRVAGENSFAFGIEDDNFLGRGIGSSFEYDSDPYRSGYAIRLSSELFSEEHVYASITYADKSDGKQHEFSIIRPFYTLNTNWASAVNYSNTKQLDSIYQNDSVVNEFDHEINNTELKYGFSDGIVDNKILRYWFGINFSEDIFSPNPQTTLMPLNRKLSYPFIELEFTENKFLVEENVFLIDTKEDIQLGFQYRGRVGFDMDSSNAGDAIIWKFSAQQTNVINDNLFFQYWLSGHGVHSSEDNLNNANISIGYQSVYKFNNQHSSFASLVYKRVQNAYIDQPNSLGGDSSLRGYPLQYQHGENTILFSFEQRYNPHIDILHLANLGFVGFVDVGKAYGESDYFNLETGYLTSVGVGARLYLSRSSGKKIVNLELIQPVNSEFQTSPEFRVSVKSYF